MKKFVLAPALAALAMFVFGFLYWGATTLPYRVLATAGDDSATALALGKIFPVTGTYLVPGMNTPEPQRAELFKRGPFALVHFVKEGMLEMDPALLAQGYVHEFVLCLILAIMLCKAAPSFKCFSCRVKFSAVVGLVVATCGLGDSIWWHHALSWQLVQGLYNLVAFIAAGVVLAFFFTPKTDAIPPAAA
jgi:hypothetical protein